MAADKQRSHEGRSPMRKRTMGQATSKTSDPAVSVLANSPGRDAAGMEEEPKAAASSPPPTGHEGCVSHLAASKYASASLDDLRSITAQFIFYQDPMKKIIRNCPKLTLQLTQDGLLPLDIDSESGTVRKHALPACYYKDGTKATRRAVVVKTRGAGLSKPQPASHGNKSPRKTQPRPVRMDVDPEELISAGVPRPVCFARSCTRSEIYRDSGRDSSLDLHKSLSSYRTTRRPVTHHRRDVTRNAYSDDECDIPSREPSYYKQASQHKNVKQTPLSTR